MGVRKGDNEDDTGFDYAMAVMKLVSQEIFKRIMIRR